MAQINNKGENKMPEDEVMNEDVELEDLEQPVEEAPAEEPALSEITIDVASFPELTDLQPGESLEVVSNDGTNIVLSISTQAPTEEMAGAGGEGMGAIAQEFE